LNAGWLFTNQKLRDNGWFREELEDVEQPIIPGKRSDAGGRFVEGRSNGAYANPSNAKSHWY
jgi:hypothetical protein